MKPVDRNLLLEDEAIILQRNYWIDRLTDYREEKCHFGESEARAISAELKEIPIEFAQPVLSRLLKLSKGSDLSLYLVLVAVLKSLIYRYTSVEDITIGSPVLKEFISERTGNQVIPLRDLLSAEMTFKEVLLALKKTTISAYENQDYPVEDVIAYLGLGKRLFESICVLENLHGTEISDHLQSHLIFQFSRREECVTGKILYPASIISDQRVAQIANHFTCLLGSAIENVDMQIARLRLLTPEGEKKILHEFNQTELQVSLTALVHQRLEEQAERTPERVAVVYESQSLTYRELNEKANQLARVLREKGVGPNQIVALLAERSVEMIIGMFAILKAGGGYLPIDPYYPIKRISTMIEDSGTDVILTQKSLLDQASIVKNVLILDDPSVYTGLKTNPENLNVVTDLAYILYTSGTTGKPKGVMIEHRNILQLVEGLRVRVYPKEPSPLNIALLAPLVFDPSVQQIFSALLQGHTLFVVPKEVIVQGNQLLAYYSRHSIDLSDGTPSHLKILVHSEKQSSERLHVKHFLIGGEVLPKHLVERFMERFDDVRPEITNVYGPTECCVDCTSYRVDLDELTRLDCVPIGQPMPNEQIFILDKNRELVPIGVPGEIYISGAGVGRGYLKREELTRERFLPNPYLAGSLMYKTGDLAKWLPDGKIQFIGRVDQQVKIRGHRIEPGEIEKLLQNYEPIREAVVTAREDRSGDKYLCAYFVATRDLLVPELREFLQQELPEYAIPTHFVQLPAIPLTSNGKVHYSLLPAPDGSVSTGREYVSARNEVEETLVQIWQEILESDRIGVYDDFFQIGGTSIKLVQMQAKVDQLYPNAISLTELFAYSTIEEIARLIAKGREEEKRVELPVLPFPADYFAQSRGSENSTLHFQVEGELLARIERICEMERLEVKDLFLALVVYLLAQTADTDEVTIQSITQKEQFSSLALQLSSVEEMTDLFHLVQEKQSQVGEKDCYTPEDLSRFALQKMQNTITPLFYMQHLFDLKPEWLAIYDLAIGMRQDAGKIKVSCDYNGRRLKREKVKEWIQNYMQLIKVLADRHQHS